jgi:hypothetical protein
MGWGYMKSKRKFSNLERKKSQLLSFNQAKQYARKLNLSNHHEWVLWAKSSDKPTNIPSSPNETYYKEWKGWADWLGSGYVHWKKKEFLTFTQARNYVRKLKLKNHTEWVLWLKNGSKPKYIPSTPHIIYSKEWINWRDFLGAGRIRGNKKIFLPFDQARYYVRKLHLKNKSKWKAWSKSFRPTNIPSNPNLHYKQKWGGWEDWLDLNYVHRRVQSFLPFDKARTYVRKLHLKNTIEWEKWAKSDYRPLNIPGNPNIVYFKKWKDWPNWLWYSNTPYHKTFYII